MNYERIVFTFEEDGKQFLLKWEAKRGNVKPTGVTTVRSVEKPDNMKRPATSGYRKERQRKYDIHRAFSASDIEILFSDDGVRIRTAKEH